MKPTARKTIAAYEVEGELAQGGMGVVYLARQPAIGRAAVIKALRRDLTQDDSLDERFRREAQAAASVHHQNVVAVYDCFNWRGERFIAQEYVDGRDLATTLSIVRRFDPRIAALVALELARGLEEIHARGIVHRDLKPSNVLLGRSGEVKIADFGIALDGKGPNLTQTGHAIGTPRYMAPEQFLGERVDGRSDLFTFGLLLYEMLAGQPAFQGSDDPDEGLLRRIEAGRYKGVRRVAPRTPAALAGIVRRCLRGKARKRLASATLLRRALERHLGSPSPADSRAEIAAWLWARGVFEEDDGHTRPQSVRRAHGSGWASWIVAATCALGILATAATTSWVSLSKLPAVAFLLELAGNR